MCSTYSHRHIQINKNTYFYFKEISRFTFITWALSCGRVCVVTGIFGSGDYRGWQIYRKMVWNGTFKICDEVQWHELQHSPVVKVHGRLMGQEDWTQDFAANLGNMTRSQQTNKHIKTTKTKQTKPKTNSPIPPPTNWGCRCSWPSPCQACMESWVWLLARYKMGVVAPVLIPTLWVSGQCWLCEILSYVSPYPFPG